MWNLRRIGLYGILAVLATVFVIATHPAIVVGVPSRPCDATQPTTSFNRAPLFDEVQQQSTQIGSDPADLYIPTSPQPGTAIAALPSALLLPGALVDRSEYVNFATQVARHGFVVVVPSHVRTIPEFGLTGELSEAAEIHEVLSYLTAANADSASPLYHRLDLSKLALLGHSHGGFVGMQAIANQCIYPFCVGAFSRPDAVVAGVFYGVNSHNPQTGAYSATANDGIPIAMIQGSRDGIATPDEAIATYNLIQTPPKVLITVAGANHYGITNDNNPAGARPDPSTPDLDQSQSVEAIANWTGYFLRAHVLQDEAAWRYVYQDGDAADPLVTLESQMAPD